MPENWDESTWAQLEVTEVVIRGISAVIIAVLVGLGGVFAAWRKIKPHLEAIRNQTENDHKSNLRDDIDKITDMVEDLSVTQSAQTEILTDLKSDVSRGKDSDLAQWERVATQAIDINTLRDRVEKLERD